MVGGAAVFVGGLVVGALNRLGTRLADRMGAVVRVCSVGILGVGPGLDGCLAMDVRVTHLADDGLRSGSHRHDNREKSNGPTHDSSGGVTK
jgi:hypothetical protein